MTEPITIAASPRVNARLQQLGSYDSPALLLLYHSGTERDIGELVEPIVTAAKPYSASQITLSPALLFLEVECEHATLRSLVSQLHTTLQSYGIQHHIAAFRHNALGKAATTYAWCGQLLNEARADGQAWLINDFQDRANWPGLSKYQAPPAPDWRTLAANKATWRQAILAYCKEHNVSLAVAKAALEAHAAAQSKAG